MERDSRRANGEVIRVDDLSAGIAAYERDGFRLRAIWPADDPRHAVLDATDRVVELRAGTAPPVVDAGERRLLVTRPSVDEIGGRAGMRYRDLIPGRIGGRYIASSIRIPDGGPVPDYVHHHDVELQMIFCAAGWVCVVYEDQGPPFVLEPGDCVLQPPGIRHRVLEASPGLEVIELSSPAEHVTFRDHELELPTDVIDPERDFGGQRFVRHVAATATTVPWRSGPWGCRDLGLTEATGGLARVAVASASAGAVDCVAAADLTFLYVLDGSVEISVGDERVAGPTGTAIVVPPGDRFRVQGAGAVLLDIAVGVAG